MPSVRRRVLKSRQSGLAREVGFGILLVVKEQRQAGRDAGANWTLRRCPADGRGGA